MRETMRIRQGLFQEINFVAESDEYCIVEVNALHCGIFRAKAEPKVAGVFA